MGSSTPSSSEGVVFSPSLISIFETTCVHFCKNPFGIFVFLNHQWKKSWMEKKKKSSQKGAKNENVNWIPFYSHDVKTPWAKRFFSRLFLRIIVVPKASSQNGQISFMCWTILISKKKLAMLVKTLFQSYMSDYTSVKAYLSR